jgi:hypothetical protein
LLHTTFERQPQVLSAPAHGTDARAGDRTGLDAQRPTQRLAQPHRLHPRTLQRLGDALAGDLNLGELRHRTIVL